MSFDDLAQLTGLRIVLIHLLVDVLVAVVAWLVSKLNTGYSFMSQPPHNLNYKLKKSMLSYSLIVAAGLVVFVMSTYSYIMSISQANLFVVFTYGLIPLVILLWLLHRQDYESI
ncbi:hypothetical protein [Brevibacillus laterosporus]|uniref:hypothetical protein n=1 Tax=Brevibacillus laterosporus TaxID=1465 RepID=UPI00265CE8F0|nr:hypothetical protein [Brevibacillus laterosporus]